MLAEIQLCGLYARNVACYPPPFPSLDHMICMCDVVARAPHVPFVYINPFLLATCNNPYNLSIKQNFDQDLQPNIKTINIHTNLLFNYLPTSTMESIKYASPLLHPCPTLLPAALLTARSIRNTVNQVSENIQGAASGASKEGNKGTLSDTSYSFR